ncbi:hypothetical protein BJ944DRAFT_243784 [Cunninghamella echinulata]|nr:hypothetical protein BJ944DRAFT_243784 [Cunninghamella echinulata]
MIDEIIEKLLNYENHQTQHLAYIYLKEIISKWMVEDDALPYLTLLFDILFKALQQKDSINTPHHYIHIYQLLTQIIIYLTKYQPNRLYYLDDIIPLLLSQWHQSIKYFLNKQYQRQPQRTSKYILFISSFKNKNMDRCDDNYNKRKEALLALMTCLCTIVESAPMKSKPCIDFLFQSILKMTACQMKSIHHDRHSFAMTTKKNNYKNQCYFPVDQQHHQHQRSHMLTFRIQLVEQSLYFMNIIIQTLGSIKGRSLIQSSKYELIDLFSILISSNWSIDLKCVTYHLLGKCYILSTDFMKPQLLHQYKSDVIKKLITLILDNSMQYQLRIVTSSIITQLIQQDTIILQPYLLSEVIETFLYLLNQIPIMIENSKEAYFIYKQIIRSLLILMDTFFIIDILPLLYKAIQNFPSHDHFSLSCSFYESLSLFKMDIGTQRWQELLINMPPSTLLALEKIQSLSPFCIQL